MANIENNENEMVKMTEDEITDELEVSEIDEGEEQTIYDPNLLAAIDALAGDDLVSFNDLIAATLTDKAADAINAYRDELAKVVFDLNAVDEDDAE